MALLSATEIKQSIRIELFHSTLQHHHIYLNYQSGLFPKAALQQPEVAAVFTINLNSWICSVGSQSLSSARLPKHWDASPYRKWYSGTGQVFIRDLINSYTEKREVMSCTLSLFKFCMNSTQSSPPITLIIHGISLVLALVFSYTFIFRPHVMTLNMGMSYLNTVCHFTCICQHSLQL